MLGSLRSRLLVLLLLLGTLAVAVGWLLLLLLRQSQSAQVGQASVQVEQACQDLAAHYRFYATGWNGPTAGLDDPALRAALATVASSALRDWPDTAGGFWQAQHGALAQAYPTTAGTPLTPTAAEWESLHSALDTALAESRTVGVQLTTDGTTRLLAACPLPGPIADLAGWTLTRLALASGADQRQVYLGLGLLLAALATTALLLGRLAWQWSRHVRRVEQDLGATAAGDWPPLALTGERELDRVLIALNEANQRLAQARSQAQVAAAHAQANERLAALGRVAAGVAHEIRNPVAAMRLKAENALAGDESRKARALDAILGQIGRLDDLLQRLLDLTQPPRLALETVALPTFCHDVLAAHEDAARLREVRLQLQVVAASGHFDPAAIRRALDNLLLNALHAAPRQSVVSLTASRRERWLVLAVSDAGSGPPEPLRAHLFEPFVTGRPEGTGLGLSLVRETARAHGGDARLADGPPTRVEILLPWPAC